MARFFVLFVALVGCGSPEPFTAVSYNGGLAQGFVAAAQDRAQGTADAVAAVDADVICVQEFWQADHVELLKAATQANYPHQYFPEPLVPEGGGDPACAEDDLNGLLECLTENCGDVCNDDLPACLLDQCAFDFIGLPKTCQGCAMANVGGTPEEVEATCTTESTSFAYDSSFGTGILSKHPIVNTDELVFDSTTNRRSALYAELDVDGTRVDAVCTHLTAVFAILPYPRETGSWAEEQAVQLGQLGDYYDEKTSGADLAVLIGDLNTGGAVGGNEAEVAANYQIIVDAGFSDPYSEGDAECTFCASNPLVSDDSPDVVIDHVLTKGFEGTTESKRIITDEITALSCGNEIPAAHSDHYGVSVTFQAE